MMMSKSMRSGTQLLESFLESDPPLHCFFWSLWFEKNIEKKHSIRWHIYIPTSTIKFNQIVGKYSLHGMGKFPQTKVYVFTTWRRRKKTKISRNTEPKRIRAVSDGEVPQRRVDIWGSIPSHAWRSSLGWGWEKDFKKTWRKGICWDTAGKQTLNCDALRPWPTKDRSVGEFGIPKSPSHPASCEKVGIPSNTSLEESGP